ncbi:unnamed protein product [Sphagnum compactum]
MGKQTKDQSRRAAAEAAAISSPSSTPAYPPPAAAFADNEAGGSIRKPGIKQARRCQDLAFLSIISLLAFGFIVDTSFGFNRGDPHRSVYGLDYKGTYSGLSMRDWEQRNYDYFDLITPDQIASSRNLTGPCYPVLFESVNCMKSSHLSTTICEGNRLDGRVDLFRDSVHEVV